MHLYLEDKVADKMLLIDLFAGAGGLSCGLEMAGFKAILANEIDQNFADTYKFNHPQTNVSVADIRQLIKNGNLRRDLGLDNTEIDLLAGGPPCQGFSINAPIRSLDDPRNHLFKDFISVAEIFQPKAILIENVPGIVSLGRGTVVEQIYKEFDRLGYNLNHRILFAAHYGVPQMRYRAIFIGVKGRNRRIKFPEPTHDANGVANFTGARELCIPIDPLFNQSLKPFTTVWDAISDLPEIEPGCVIEKYPYKTPSKNAYQKYLRRNSKYIHNHYCSRLAKINLERLKYIPQGGSWRNIPFELLPAGLKRARRSDHTKRYGRLHPNSLCSTIMTKCDPHWGSFFHPTQDRVLSVREAARIQSFPDRFLLFGSLTQQYEQVGNAVPPLMAKAIGQTIKELING